MFHQRARMNALRIVAAAAVAAAPFAAHAAQAAYACGGVGQGEQERMKAQAANHDAFLTFAQQGGAYLADVDVRVVDSRGAEVLRVRCDGPLMLLDLPAAGTYKVSATVDGQARDKTIHVGRGTARAVFLWPARP
jgi:hypothetical protein